MLDHSGQQILMAKINERLVMNKQRSHRIHMESFNPKKLNKIEGKQQYHIEVSNRFAALENLDAELDIYSAWEIVRETLNI
jgi:hypothetical protein